MNTRLTINLAAGIVEAEGPPELIERIYSDLRDTIVSRSSTLPPPTRPASPQEQPPPSPEEAGELADDGSAKSKKPRRRTKSGPSCASRIQALKEEGYFSELRSGNDVGGKLREKGTAYEAKHVAASLIDLVRRGALRRVSEGGSWSYQNP